MPGILDTPSKPRAVFFAVSGLALLGMGLFDALTSEFTVAIACDRAGEAAARCAVVRSSVLSSSATEIGRISGARLETREPGSSREYQEVLLVTDGGQVPMVRNFRLVSADAERMQKAIDALATSGGTRVQDGAEAPASRRLGGIGFGLLFASCFASAAWLVRPGKR